MINMHVGDAGASALAAALGRGALPRLENLVLYNAAIGDVGLVALAPALRRLPALDILDLGRNPFGNEALAALVAPPPPALTSAAAVLTKLQELKLIDTQVTDAGIAALVAALDSGAVPALKSFVNTTGALSAAEAAVGEALAKRDPHYQRLW